MRTSQRALAVSAVVAALGVVAVQQAVRPSDRTLPAQAPAAPVLWTGTAAVLRLPAPALLPLPLWDLEPPGYDLPRAGPRARPPAAGRRRSLAGGRPATYAPGADAHLRRRVADEPRLRHERPLRQRAPRRVGDKLFVHTGNTDYGVQDLEHYPYTGTWTMAVSEGRKPAPNHSLYLVDDDAQPRRGVLRGQPTASAACPCRCCRSVSATGRPGSTAGSPRAATAWTRSGTASTTSRGGHGSRRTACSGRRGTCTCTTGPPRSAALAPVRRPVPSATPVRTPRGRPHRVRPGPVPPGGPPGPRTKTSSRGCRAPGPRPRRRPCAGRRSAGCSRPPRRR